MRYFMLFCLACVLTACANTNYYQQTVQSWQGGTEKNLLAQWGKPDEKVVSPNGNKALVYYINRSRTTTPASSPVVGVHIGQDGRPVIMSSPNTNNSWSRGPSSLACTTMFEINPAGKIINTQSKGPGCFATEAYYKTRGRDRTLI